VFSRRVKIPKGRGWKKRSLERQGKSKCNNNKTSWIFKNCQNDEPVKRGKTDTKKVGGKKKATPRATGISLFQQKRSKEIRVAVVRRRGG